jgi:hypothetical protein
MRVPGALGLLLLVPLSGCLQGDTGTSFAPTCPNWTLGDHPLTTLGDATLYQPKDSLTQRTNSETIPVGNGKDPVQPPADQGGKRADRYLLRFPGVTGAPIVVENGTLTFRVYRQDGGEQLAITDYDHPDQTRTEWSFPPGYVGGAALQVSLGPATQDPKPGVLRLDSTFVASPGYTIGVRTSTHPQQSGASFSMSPTVLYRAVGCVAKAA